MMVKAIQITFLSTFMQAFIINFFFIIMQNDNKGEFYLQSCFLIHLPKKKSHK